jgi:hypothetical protein
MSVLLHVTGVLFKATSGIEFVSKRHFTGLMFFFITDCLDGLLRIMIVLRIYFSLLLCTQSGRMCVWALRQSLVSHAQPHKLLNGFSEI